MRPVFLASVVVGTITATAFLASMLAGMSWSQFTEYLSVHLMGTGIYWVIGFVLALIILTPLSHILKLGSKWFTLLIFVIVGFTFAGTIEYIYGHWGPHRNDELSLANTDPGKFVSNVLFLGGIGAVCALAAWYIMTKAENRNAPNN